MERFFKGGGLTRRQQRWKMAGWAIGKGEKTEHCTTICTENWKKSRKKA
jgi:hypothetical protein